MTREEKIIQLEKMLRKVPDALSPMKASRCSPLGKNHIYELIKSGELRAFVYKGSYLIAKIDLIEYLANHSDEKSRRNYMIKKDGDKR